jgi:hypothetical protein
MDCSAAIEMNRVALKRILAMLVAMAGLADSFTSPLRGGRRSPDRRVGVIEAPQPPPDASRRPPLKGEVGLALPRHLHRAILRLLRPAEAAARRLVIVVARGLVVKLPPPRKPRPKPMEPLLRRFGIAVVMSPADLAKAAAARRTAARRAAARQRPFSLPLFDPLPRVPPELVEVSKGRRRYVPAHAAPRILFPGVTEPFSLPPPPSPDDPIDAARLGRRLAALAAALDDLPGHARRFARWKAARDAAGAQRKDHAAAGAQRADHDIRRSEPAPGRFRRISPLRRGRPPGGRLTRYDPTASHPRKIREVDEILAHAHALALYALEAPDTS